MYRIVSADIKIKNYRIKAFGLARLTKLVLLYDFYFDIRRKLCV